MRTAAIVLLTVWALAACGGPTATDVTGQPNLDREGWGPLAVSSEDGHSGDALIQGTLRVTDECVLLDEQGEDVLLVWGAAQVTWNADDRAVEFEGDEGTVVVANDDQVRLSGGGSSVEEGGAAPEQWAEAIDWTAEPAPACPADTRWFVGDVQSLSSE